MPKKIITASHELWLKENFETKSNEELAKELSMRIKKEYLAELKRLYKLLPEIKDKAMQKATMERIVRLQSFKSISKAYIATWARNHGCGLKRREVIASLNKDKALQSKIVRWSRMAIDLSGKPKDFIYLLRARDVKVINITSAKLLEQIVNAITDYNKYESRKTGLRIRYTDIPDAKLLRVEATIIR